MIKKYKIIIVILFAVSICLTVFIDKYSSVNSVSRGLLMSYILYPILTIEFLIAIFAFAIQKGKIFFTIQTILSAFILGWFVYYVLILK